MPIASAAGSAGGAIAGFVFIILGAAFYLAPGIVASSRHVPNAGSVWVLNVLLGWTLVGWAVALAMACRSKYQAVMTPYQYPGPGYLPPPGFQPPPAQPQAYQPPLADGKYPIHNPEPDKPYGYQ